MVSRRGCGRSGPSAPTTRACPLTLQADSFEATCGTRVAESQFQTWFLRDTGEIVNYWATCVSRHGRQKGAEVVTAPCDDSSLSAGSSDAVRT